MAQSAPTQAQITRTLIAARKAGIEPSRVEVDPVSGKIVFWNAAFTGDNPGADEPNPWDEDDEPS